MKLPESVEGAQTSFGVIASKVNEVNGLPYYQPTPASIAINNHERETEPKILFNNVKIFDSTGSDPFLGDVLIEGERITQVGTVVFTPDANTKVIEGHGRKTLMSGLCDSHTHLTFNDAVRLSDVTDQSLEEHVLCTARNATLYLDCGYTMCFGAASARPKLDLVIKQAIDKGRLAGPRTLANAQEISTTGGAIGPNITAYADGEEGMRIAVREAIALGVDNIKLSMTGDNGVEDMPAEETYFTLKETKVAVEEAHNRGKRICAHARSAASVRLCALAGVDVIYHASYADEEGIAMLEKLKDQIFVSPAINLVLQACIGTGIPFGLTPQMAEKKGLKHELDAAIKAMIDMHQRGIRVLPGGDFGFAWAPHGTYAKDLENFVNLLGFTAKEALIAATAQGGEIMGHPEELGKVLPGYYGDVILVDGDPLTDIAVLQDRARLHTIVINGKVHKNVS